MAYHYHRRGHDSLDVPLLFGGDGDDDVSSVEQAKLLAARQAVLRASRRHVLPGGGRGLVQIGGSYHALVLVRVRVRVRVRVG